MVNSDEIRRAIRELRLEGKPVCLHSSLRSFGQVEGGASAVVDAFLSEGCTLLVPAFSWSYSVSPPLHLQFPRNAADYEYLSRTRTDVDCVFDPETSTEIDENMGAISAAVLRRAESRRGNHPICSFSASGPLADQLVKGQKADDVYAPLDASADRGGHVLLAGVDLSTMTLIHLAEKKAGRVLFRRWANGPDGYPIAVEAGGCSGGFTRLESALAPYLREGRAGESDWRAYPASDALAAATQAIVDDPHITHCENIACGRCDDVIAGGPILK